MVLVVKRYRALLALAGLAVMTIAGCSPEPQASPYASVDEVEAVLSDVYEARDSPDGVCQFASSQGNCRALLQDATPAPEARPEIVCSTPYDGGDPYADGLLIRVVTRLDDGSSATADLMALGTGEDVTLMNPVYWMPARVSDGDVSGEYVEPDCA